MTPAPGAHYDVVVVGSGFGGAVVARRLSDAGRSVCVLERGRAYAPGEFPRSPLGMKRNFWDPDAGLHGLYDYWSFRGIDALVGAGVGGGSLIYANVLLRKDEETFAREGWPIRRADLEPGYDAAERMLGARPYPHGDVTPKTQAFSAAARRAGFEPFQPPLAVDHGACRLCGECTLGCNYGAKNTLDLTYLAGTRAEVHSRCEARTVKPCESGGYEIGYVEHDDRARRTAWLHERTITADRVVLAAGALATTRLLLRNRAHLPRLGPALGTRFSGNGDLLTLSVASRHDMDPTRGPTITTAVRGEDFWLEEAGFPSLIQWLIQSLDAPALPWRYRHFLSRYVPLKLGLNVRTDMGRAVSELFGSARRAHGTLPLLGMGRDEASGTLTLRGEHLALDWRTRESQELFHRLRGAARAVTRELGGTFVDSPLWRLERVVTVHPLGGAPMGANPQAGVVDTSGECFGHPGLYVTCGAAMPGPVGPNPSLTIAAWAEHVAVRISERTARAGAR